MIVTDLDALRQKSERVTDLEIGEVVEQLTSNMPENALGLAAPQIGLYKRVFLANLSCGSFAFINPEIIIKSEKMVPSTEACLSIPNVNRCIKRHYEVTIKAYKLLSLENGEMQFDAELNLSGMDSFIVQHENDHLDGVLILDHEETLSQEAIYHQKQQERRHKILKKRLEKKNKEAAKPPEKPKKINAKKAAKLKREAKKKKRERQRAARRDKIRVGIQERYEAQQKGLFDEAKDSDTEPSNQAEQSA